MTSLDDFNDALKGTLSKKQDFKPPWPATVGDDDHVIDVPGVPNHIYVKMTDRVASVYNNRVSATLDLPVWVGFDALRPELLQVLSVRASLPRYGEDDETIFDVKPHHKSHQYPNKDTVFIQQRQIMPLLVSPAGGMNISIHRGVIYAGTTVIEIAPTALTDLSSYSIFDDTGDGAKFVLIEITSAGAVNVVEGVETTLALLDLGDVPVYSAGAYPIAAIRIYSGQTAIAESRSQTDILDLRGAIAGQSWSITFIGDTDTPSTYASQAGKFPKVNVGETALEFFDIDTTHLLLDASNDPITNMLEISIPAGGKILSLLASTTFEVGYFNYDSGTGKLQLIGSPFGALELKSQADEDIILNPGTGKVTATVTDAAANTTRTVLSAVGRLTQASSANHPLYGLIADMGVALETGITNTDTAFGFIGGVNVLGTHLGTLGNAIGLQPTIQLLDGAGGAITNVYGEKVIPLTYTGTVTTAITNLYGKSITSPTVGGGSVTNLYGLNIEDMTLGGTLNFAIKTGVGLVDFGDTVKTGSGRIKNTTRYTTTQTIPTTDEVVFANTDGGAWTATLSAGVEGQRIRVINCGSSGNDLTIDGDGAETVRGAATQIVSDSEIIILVYNATEGWW